VYQTITGSIAQSVGVSPQRNGEINVDEKTATESSPQEARLRGCPPTKRGGLRRPYLSACLAKKFWKNAKQEVAVNTIEENYQAEGVKVGRIFPRSNEGKLLCRRELGEFESQDVVMLCEYLS